MIKKYLRRIATFVMASLAMSTLVVFDKAMAADYPTRPIKIIVPFAAGGGADNTIRVMVPALEKRLGQPVVVTNIPSGTGAVGVSTVAQSQPDGYTIGMSTGTTFGGNQVYTAKMPYDANTDFEYVAVIGESQRAVFVASNSAIKDHKDLVKQAKTNEKFTMAAGVKSNDLMNAELWKASTKNSSLVVTYGASGTPAMILDLITDRTQAVWNNVPSMASCVNNQTCRPVAVTGRNRLPEFPDVPTFTELGVKGINAPSFFGIIAPAGTPFNVQAKLNSAFNDVLADQEIKAKLKKLGLVAFTVDPAEARQVHFDAIVLGKKAGQLMGVKPE